MRFTYETRAGRNGAITYSKTVNLGTDAVTGKRRQKRLTATTVKDLKRQWLELQHALDRGTYLEPTTASVAEYLERWLAAIESTVRPATFDRYTRIAKGQIIPTLGAVPVAKLAPLAVQDWESGLLAGGRSTSTVALYHGVLHRALDQAVKWRMIDRNPCDAVDAPRPRNPEMKTWTAEQARAFLAGVAGDPLHALWVLAVHTGMRRGELLGLRWADVDLDRGNVAVRRTVSRGKDGLVIGDPKTAAGRRSIAVPPSVVAALRAHRARQNERRLAMGELWNDEDIVFDRGDGTILHPNVVTHSFPRLTGRCRMPDGQALPRIRFHDLRHTAATLMLAIGEHPKIVQERLGHSDIAMTLNRYSHVTPAMQREASDRLARVLEG